MQIFYFSKKALRWVIILVVAIIIIWVFTKILGGRNPSQSTLMTAQILDQIKGPMLI